MGFALFSTAQQAMAAKTAVQVILFEIFFGVLELLFDFGFFLSLKVMCWGFQDLVFDADKKSVLHTEMAKKNLYVKRGRLCVLSGLFSSS